MGGSAANSTRPAMKVSTLEFHDDERLPSGMVTVPGRERKKPKCRSLKTDRRKA